MPADFMNPSYLAHGTPRQRQAYRALMTLGVFRRLRTFTPVLTGTVPLNLDVPGSDLDVVCHAPDLEAFARLLRFEFGACAGFHLAIEEVNGTPSVVAGFRYSGFPFEVFAQAQPVAQQRAYRHLAVEARLLAIGGEAAHRAIRRLRDEGLKTEPAFARYFGLSGDPYEALLALTHADDDELRAIVRQATK